MYESIEQNLTNNYEDIRRLLHRSFFSPYEYRYGICADDLVSMTFIRMKKHFERKYERQPLYDANSYKTMFVSSARYVMVDHIRKFKASRDREGKARTVGRHRNAIREFEYVDFEINVDRHVAEWLSCVDNGWSKKLLGTTDHEKIKAIEKEAMRCLTFHGIMSDTDE